MNAKTQRFLQEAFCPALREDLAVSLQEPFRLELHPTTPQVVCFHYPSVLGDITNVPKVILLEIGALAAWCPAVPGAITPYVAAHYPHLFPEGPLHIRTSAPERTFWEKATILHQEAHHPPQKAWPDRYARHYYDLYRMANSGVKETAFANLDLLRQVVQFKMTFYPSKWANYETAHPGTFRLMPPSERLPEIRQDFAHMREMFFALEGEEIPSLDEILQGLQHLEEEINALHA